MQFTVPLAQGVDLTVKFDLAHWAKVRQAIARGDHTPSSVIGHPNHPFMGKKLTAQEDTYIVGMVHSVWLCGWLTCVLLEKEGQFTQAVSLQDARGNPALEAMRARTPRIFSDKDGADFLEIPREFNVVF